MNFDNDYSEALRKIREDSKNRPYGCCAPINRGNGATGPTGATGGTGPVGPTGATVAY